MIVSAEDKTYLYDLVIASAVDSEGEDCEVVMTMDGSERSVVIGWRKWTGKFSDVSYYCVGTPSVNMLRRYMPYADLFTHACDARLYGIRRVRFDTMRLVRMRFTVTVSAKEEECSTS